jgi:hypothetical protein
MVQVELRPFNDRALNRDLAVLCERVNQASPRLPDGRRLSFTIQPSCCVLAAQKISKIRLPGKRRYYRKGKWLIPLSQNGKAAGSLVS